MAMARGGEKGKAEERGRAGEKNGPANGDCLDRGGSKLHFRLKRKRKRTGGSGGAHRRLL